MSATLWAGGGSPRAGSMGAAVAGQAHRSGAEVLWCPAGRSPATHDRAARHGLTAAGGVAELTERADIILSICPPAHAEDVAAEVSAYPFAGIYVDANAIAPATMARVSAIMLRTAATVVDGAVNGSPPSASKLTRLYLSGPEEATASVASLFEGTAAQAHVLAGGVGRASALSCHTAATKRQAASWRPSRTPSLGITESKRSYSTSQSSAAEAPWPRRPISRRLPRGRGAGDLRWRKWSQHSGRPSSRLTSRRRQPPS